MSQSFKNDQIESLVLADCEGYQITYHKNIIQTDILVISFGGLPSKKTPTGFGSNFILKCGFDHIFVAQKALSQYQYLSLNDFEKIISPFIKDKKVYTYGSSLGGYSALYYAGSINAQAIAAAPKNSAHPSLNKKKFQHVKFMHSELHENKISDKAPLIIYDPHQSEENSYIMDYVSIAYPQAKLVTIPFGGHTVLQTMAESKILKDFILSFILEDKIIPIEIQKNESYIWNAEYGIYLYKKNNIERAIDYLRKSLNYKFQKNTFKYLLNCFKKINDVKSGQDLIDFISKDGIDLSFISTDLVDFFVKKDTKKISNTNFNDYEGQALIILSYDDGQKNNFENVLPLHQKYNIPGSFAIITDRMQGQKFHKKFMNTTEVKVAHNCGIEIVSHGVYHKKDEQFTMISKDKLDYELSYSKKILEEILNEDIKTICVPFSAYNNQVIDHCRKYYPYVRINGSKCNNINVENKVIYSFGLKNTTTIDDIKSWIDNAVENKYLITLMFHSVLNVDAIEKDNIYGITLALLEKVLIYINSLGKSKILPIRFNDIEKIKKIEL